MGGRVSGSDGRHRVDWTIALIATMVMVGALLSMLSGFRGV